LIVRCRRRRPERAPTVGISGRWRGPCRAITDRSCDVVFSSSERVATSLAAALEPIGGVRAMSGRAGLGRSKAPESCAESEHRPIVADVELGVVFVVFWGLVALVLWAVSAVIRRTRR
jgi:hypothetical protein